MGLLQQKERQQHQHALKERDKQIALLEQRIEALKKRRWSIPLSRRKNAKSGRPFVRVIIPDTHGCYIDKQAFAIVLSDLEALAAKEVVWLGDHVDCGGFLAQHHTLGFVAQTDYTFEQDIDSANGQLDAVQARTKKAVHHFLFGNHEDRVERWIVNQTLRNGRDAAFLQKHIGIRSQLSLDKRGFSVYDRGGQHCGLRVRGAIKLGHCHFTHGFSSAADATGVTLRKYAGNVVFGHVHRSRESSASPVHVGTIKAWSLGCLCQLVPMWRHTDPTDWNHGYAVQLVLDDGSFMHCQVPIIDGKSHLIGFMDSKGVI